MTQRAPLFAFVFVFASAFAASTGWALPCPPAAVVEAQRVVLRERPTGFSRAVGGLARGDLVEVLACDGRWMRVGLGDLAGWTLARRLEPRRPAPDPVEPDSSQGARTATPAGPSSHDVASPPETAEEAEAPPARGEPVPALAPPPARTLTSERVAPIRRTSLVAAPPVAVGSAPVRAMPLPVVEAHSSVARSPGPGEDGSILLARVLILREWPGWSAPTAGSCVPGRRVRVLDRTGGWCFVEEESGRRGWVVEAALSARPAS